MKNIIVIAILVLSNICARAQKQLVIIHSNDSHSTVMPLSKNLADTFKADRGGFVRRVSYIKQERKKHPDLLLFDSGDFSQGSPYYTLFKGDVEVGLMNEMKYDAATIGNHEFDFGLDNMARLFKKCNFPIVCSNYDFTGTVLEGIVKPYVIIKRNGVKIGIFALCPKLDGLVLKKFYGDVKFEDPVKKANEYADFLKNKKKCDMVICLSHLGWNSNQYGDVTVFNKTRNIDLVLGGHSHTYFRKMEYVKNLDGKDVPFDQNGKHSIFLGKLIVDMDKK